MQIVDIITFFFHFWPMLAAMYIEMKVFFMYAYLIFNM